MSTPEQPGDLDLAAIRARAERHAELETFAGGVVTAEQYAAAVMSAADVLPLLARLDTARASARGWHAEALLRERNHADRVAEVERLRRQVERMAATIDAVPDAHPAANLAHARRQRDQALAEVERLTTVAAVAEAAGTGLLDQRDELLADNERLRGELADVRTELLHRRERDIARDRRVAVSTLRASCDIMCQRDAELLAEQAAAIEVGTVRPDLAAARTGLAHQIERVIDPDLRAARDAEAGDHCPCPDAACGVHCLMGAFIAARERAAAAAALRMAVRNSEYIGSCTEPELLRIADRIEAGTLTVEVDHG